MWLLCASGSGIYLFLQQVKFHIKLQALVPHLWTSNRENESHCFTVHSSEGAAVPSWNNELQHKMVPAHDTSYHHKTAPPSGAAKFLSPKTESHLESASVPQLPMTGLVLISADLQG